jgi:hypothetical protein
MTDSNVHEALDDGGVSRRDFLKLCSLAIGAWALPSLYTNPIEQALFETKPDPFIPQLYFQWQNEFLCKTVYPMREIKLRDFLIYYMEVDIWSQYKDKDINTLTDEVAAYITAWELNAVAAQQEYETLRAYFLKADVSAEYSNFQPADEMELIEINRLHALFAESWPKDIRGERSFLEGIIPNWTFHRNGMRDWVRTRRRRLEVMALDHPKRLIETKELEIMENSKLPMAEQEMTLLQAFLATYNRIEERKVAWYRLSKNDPNFKTPEAEFIVKYPPGQQVTIRDIAYWKVEEYTKSIADKNQYELLDLINQRFTKEPTRYPQWLQYMVVHFSGMRYASAHGSWADPKNLMVRLSALDVERELKPLDDAEIERRCNEKVAAYESTDETNKPKLALSLEKEWTDQVQFHLASIKSSGPQTRRAGLIALQKDEVSYELQSLSTESALEKLLEMKSTFPNWAWKEIVKFTPLRVTEVNDLGWEKLTPQEEEERYALQNNDLRAIMDVWEGLDPSAWRDEHGRTLELIVTRAVCNETAEHCQHIRGHLPPGGLAARPKWYVAKERENILPGSYYVKPTSEKDYMQGASILWLRFVNSATSNPTEWQVAKWIETKQKVGLLPDEFRKKKAKVGEWAYKFDEVITRARRIITADKKKVVENQWLRWIHEATVAEVAETADGMTVITFETALPDSDKATSSVGINKLQLSWLLSDGTEELYNRSFVGFVPEGQAPVEHLQKMLDWNKIFRI